MVSRELGCSLQSRYAPSARQPPNWRRMNATNRPSTLSGPPADDLTARLGLSRVSDQACAVQRCWSLVGAIPTWQLSRSSQSRRAGRGNETFGAFETMCRLGDAANRHAVTRVNVEHASKRTMWTPTLHLGGEGRSRLRACKRLEYAISRTI
jgi:hypothetical protein